MEPAFRGHLSTVLSLRSAPSRGILGGKVTKLERTKPRTLSVRRSFEPSRIAPAHLSDAYERVVPVSGRAIHSDRPTGRGRQTEPKQHKGGV